MPDLKPLEEQEPTFEPLDVTAGSIEEGYHV